MIGNDLGACDTIRATIEQYCHDMVFQGMAPDPAYTTSNGSQHPDMIFWDAQDSIATRHVAADTFPSETINVLLLKEPLAAHAQLARPAWSTVHACLHKPLYVPELLIALSNGRSMMELRRGFLAQQKALERIMNRQSDPGMVGIPTEEGMEFIPAQDIVRCEGLNKYTLIVTASNAQIVSSYNIGEFAKILQVYGFFAPHKSHLVNLRCIRKLTHENQIILKDGTQVPLSRRRRLDFVQRFRGGK